MKQAKLKFKEDFNKGCVVVYEGKKVLFSSGEYSVAAKWAKERFALSDNELMELYRSYKRDYEKRRHQQQ